MSAFDVLDPKTEIEKSRLLEASAGTGKTFSIENIVRRLLENDYCTMDRMLIVTFTRAATRDLKGRIRSNLMEAWEADPENRALHQALLNFDRANIETIHGFCSRTLREHVFESDAGMDVITDDQPFSNTLLQQMIYDFFRTGLDERRYSPAQLELVRSRLDSELLKKVKAGVTVVQTRDFSELFEAFREQAKQFRGNADGIVDEFERLKSYYNKCNSEASAAVKRFAAIMAKDEITPQDFDILIQDDLLFAKLLVYENRNKKKKQDPPESILAHQFRESLLPIVTEARDTEFIFGRIVRDCLEMVERYIASEELMRLDDLLTFMDRAVQNRAFCDKIQERYRVIIVDEFQDTDPVQWSIFKAIASDWKGLLYLVGDPKQSIYAFRNADIYTYLDAASFLGEEARASLLTNYRSTPQLVEALNRFFSVPGLIPLPRTASELPYPIVNASEKTPPRDFGDSLGTVHFMVARQEDKGWKSQILEAEKIFPAMAREIKRLGGDIAILVRTNEQGRRVAEYLNQCGIAAAASKSKNLTESDAYKAFRELLLGIIYPKEEHYFKAMLGNVLVGKCDYDFSRLESEERREEYFAICTELRKLLFEEGFAPFVRHLFKSVWPGSTVSFTARILNREDGFAVYEELMHLVELILQRECEEPLSPEGVLAFLDELKVLEFEEDKSIRPLSAVDSGAVKIMSMHASKGLEFDVVFALGLMDRTLAPKRLVPIREKKILEPVLDEEDPRYQLYCAELDAEKMRQLYVVMTRAKQRVYVPVIEAPNVKEAKAGTASPFELYLEKLGEPLESFVSRQPKEQMTYEVLETAEMPAREPSELRKVPLPVQVTIPGKARFIDSFSSMYSSSADQTLKPPHDFHTEEKTIHTLPAGSETGIILHRLLEKIPFRHYRDSKEIEPLLVIEEAYSEWRPVLAECVYEALHAPLDGFCLADIDSDAVYREVEFLYPTPNGFTKGVIDLAFSYRGTCYLLDWKSNWLGPDNEAYRPEHLQEVMEHHHYYRQAEIYEEAFERYLNLFDNARFGGTFYVFLRGMAVLLVDKISAASRNIE